jgi:hypothetical protein
MSRYFTTDRNGQRVEVSEDLYRQLIETGKRTQDQFEMVSLDDTLDQFQTDQSQISQAGMTYPSVDEVAKQVAQRPYMGTREGFDAGDIAEVAFPLTTYGAKQGWGVIPSIGAGILDAASIALPIKASHGIRGLAIGKRAAAPVAADALTSAGLVGLQTASMDGDPLVGAGIGAVAPVAGVGVSKGLRALGRPMQETGKRIVESVIKPQKNVMRSGFNTSELFERDLVGGLQGPKKMSENVDTYRSALKSEYGEQLKKLEGKTVDLDAAYKQTLKEIDKMFVDPSEAFLAKRARSAAKEFGDLAFMQGGKETPVDRAVAFRRAVGAEGKFSSDPDAVVRGKALFANKFYRNINKQLDQFPETRELDKGLSATKSLEQGLDAAVERTGKNQILSFGDMAALGFGAGAGSFTGNPALGGLAMLAYRKASMSPAVANRLWQLGGALPSVAPYAGRGATIAGQRSAPIFEQYPIGE